MYVVILNRMGVNKARIKGPFRALSMGSESDSRAVETVTGSCGEELGESTKSNTFVTCHRIGVLLGYQKTGKDGPHQRHTASVNSE